MLLKDIIGESTILMNESKLTVNSHDYTYETNKSGVVVKNAEGQVVAKAKIDHNVEQIFTEIDGEEGTAKYFDFESKPRELAKWMIHQLYD